MAPSRRASSAGVVATRAAAAPSSSAAAAAAQPLLALAARAQAAAGLGHLTAEEALVFAWFALDAWTHFVIEGLYLFFAVTERASAANSGGAEHSKNPLAFIWREYGRADRRWMTYADPDVMAVELPTVLLMGPGALLCAWATLHRKEWKHVAIILVSWCEIIGGWYTFASTWIKHYFHGLAWDKSDFKGSTSSENAYIFWVLLVFMNIVWVIVPAILMYDACVLSVARKGAAAPPPSAKLGAYYVLAATLVAYGTLVPTALYLAQK